MNIIELKNVKKDYPLGKTIVHAVKGVDLTVEEGDFMSIVGPSGCGKTTLLNVIGCIDKATSGSVKVDGKVVFSDIPGDINSYLADNKKEKDMILQKTEDYSALYMNDRKVTDLRLYKIGFIFQTFNLIPVLDVVENVEFPLLLMQSAQKEIKKEIGSIEKDSNDSLDFSQQKLTKKEVRERAESLIEKVGLKEYIKHRPAELSGGQRQRVAVARALVTNPDIILADEPTANLDSATGESILELMREMNRTDKTTFIFSTHNPDVLKYANKICRLKDGLFVD